MDMTDRRLISEMQFGLEAGKELGEEERKAEQQRVTEHVRVLLGECGCVVADDINRLGCTGVARMFPANPITTGAELRMDLAGGGVGLPCFVPPTLFCLVHNTIGGLEDKQKAYFTDEVGKVSRALTDAEAATVAAMDRVRRMKRTDAEEFIAGRSAAEADEVAGDDGADVIDGQLSRAELDVALGRDIWSCDRGRVLTAIAGAGEFGIQRATLLRTVRMESTFLEMILNTLREEFSISLSRDADRGEVYKITAVGAVEASARSMTSVFLTLKRSSSSARAHHRGSVKSTTRRTGSADIVWRRRWWRGRWSRVTWWHSTICHRRATPSALAIWRRLSKAGTKTA